MKSCPFLSNPFPTLSRAALGRVPGLGSSSLDSCSGFKFTTFSKSAATSSLNAPYLRSVESNPDHWVVCFNRSTVFLGFGSLKVVALFDFFPFGYLCFICLFWCLTYFVCVCVCGLCFLSLQLDREIPEGQGPWVMLTQISVQS